MRNKGRATTSACIIFSILFSLVMIGWVILGTYLHSYGAREVMEEASPPTLTVVLDAGHGGEDGGAIGVNGIYEKDINLSIAQKVSHLLGTVGRKTVLTRTEDVLLYDKTSDYQGKKKVQDLATRRRICEQTQNAVFVSIHMNAFPQKQYGGLQVWYSPNHPDSHTLATLIQEDSRALLLPDNNRQVKPSDQNLYLLHHLRCPAVLVECGFLSNPEECTRLATEEYQKQLSLSIALSILSYCQNYEKTSQKQLDFSENLLYNEGVDPMELICLGGDHERRKNSIYLFFL